MTQQMPPYGEPTQPYSPATPPYSAPTPPYGQPMPPYGQMPPGYQPPNLPPPGRPSWMVPVIVVVVALVVGVLGLVVGHYVWSPTGPAITDTEPSSTGPAITDVGPSPTESFPQPSDTATTDDQTPSQPTDTAPACPSGITLPDGVDAMVCGGMPADAISGLRITASDGTDVPGFGSPSGALGCDDDGEYDGEGTSVMVECLGHNTTWKMPADLVAACESANKGNPNAFCQSKVIGLDKGKPQVINRGDVTAWENANLLKGKIPVLEAGQVANLAQVACLSSGDSLTCWDITTHHGFKMSLSQLAAW